MSDARAGPSRSENAGGDAGLGGAPQDPVNLAADQLNYVADLVLELKSISERLGAGTLATILGLAHAEAQQELRRRAR